MKTYIIEKKLFENIEELFNYCDNQVTAEDVLKERIYGPEGWENIKLTYNLRKQIARNVAEVIGGRKETKKNVFINLLNDRRSHWGLKRIFLEDYGNGPKWSYCAGQDHTYELSQIRKDLKL